MKIITLILTLSLLLVNQVVFAKNKAGIVILSKGDFFAVGADKNKRKLKRRSPIYPGDILETGDDSLSQVRFIDNAIISLHPNTSLRIDQYTLASNDTSTKDSGVISLLKGGFRTITGKIKKGDYKVNTEVASIGIRGTEYEVVLGKNLNIAAWSGAITVSNKSGSLSLGKGHSYNFANIGAGGSLKGLLKPPKILSQSKARVLSRGIKKIKNKQIRKIKLANVVRTKKSVFNFIDNKNTVKPPEFNTSLDNTQLQGSSSTSKDLSSIKLNRLGIGVIAGPNRPRFFGGKASSGETGTPVITDNGYGPHELPEFINAAPNFALWRNGSLLTGHQNVTIDGKVVSYGKWSNSTDPYPILQVDPLGAASESRITDSVYWITAQASAPTVVAARTGTASYNTVGGFIGNINGTSISTFSASIDIDYNTGTITSNSNISFSLISTPVWNIVLSGSVKSNVLDAQISSATIDSVTTQIKGDIPMVLTGNNANGIAGAFNLEEDGNPANHAEGVFTVYDCGAC